ncbi:MAG: hypothetical protein V2I33_23195 [Kangiellaceae bacterium]|nr:hypothetical protein [Kangiellaceae bacterium]
MGEPQISGRGFASPEEKTAALEVSRQRFLEESKSDTTLKPRYGLFSYTGTLAIGENSSTFRNIRGRDEYGKVATGPRNFYTSPGKRGTVHKAYFS